MVREGAERHVGREMSAVIYNNLVACMLCDVICG
jgi:hypothetical protein